MRKLVVALPELMPNLSVSDVRLARPTGASLEPELAATIRYGRLKRRLIIEFASLGEPRIAERAMTRLRRRAREVRGAYPMFAAPYLSPRARDVCRQEGVGYLDLSGNVYLATGPILVERVSEGDHQAARRALRSILSRKATRVLRALLLNPATTFQVTELARLCSISPAGAYLVAEALDARGFVSRTEKRRIRVIDPRRLLLDWASNWTIEKSPASRFFAFEKSPERLMQSVADAANSHGVPYAFTGMAGASLVAPFTRYESVSAYVVDRENVLPAALDVRPVSTGANLVLLSPFDEGVFLGAHEVRGLRTVSDIQLFVDLYNDPARGREQADHLLETSIRFPEAP